MRVPLWLIIAIGLVLTVIYAVIYVVFAWYLLGVVETALSKHEPSTQVIVVPAEVGIEDKTDAMQWGRKDGKVAVLR